MLTTAGESLLGTDDLTTTGGLLCGRLIFDACSDTHAGFVATDFEIGAAEAVSLGVLLAGTGPWVGTIFFDGYNTLLTGSLTTSGAICRIDSLGGGLLGACDRLFIS